MSKSVSWGWSRFEVGFLDRVVVMYHVPSLSQSMWWWSRFQAGWGGAVVYYVALFMYLLYHLFSLRSDGRCPCEVRSQSYMHCVLENFSFFTRS